MPAVKDKAGQSLTVGCKAEYRPIPGEPPIVGTVTGITKHGVVTIIRATPERIERHFTGTAAVVALTKPRRLT